MKLQLWIALSLISSFAMAASYESKLFEMGSKFTKPIFLGKREEPKAGYASLKFLALNGTELVREELIAEGPHVQAYDLDHKQIGEKGSLIVRGDKVFFTYVRDGKTETATEDAVENLIVGPTTVPYLHAHWAELMKGDTVSVRYAALDRKETVGFKFFKTEEKIEAGDEVVVIKMKPTSFIIAAIVDPLYFTFRKKDSVLLTLVGRTLPKTKVGDKWKDVDAEIKFTYPSQE